MSVVKDVDLEAMPSSIFVNDDDNDDDEMSDESAKLVVVSKNSSYLTVWLMKCHIVSL